ncbi:uncharacterized protein [Zea mays]|uniref:uncharacterized protein n=1 Tax=Zea mays TaxID=4577 RepID=UPI0016526F44|nr:uncharacterized protein LOC109942987 [Zea mays]
MCLSSAAESRSNVAVMVVLLLLLATRMWIAAFAVLECLPRKEKRRPRPFLGDPRHCHWDQPRGQRTTRDVPPSNRGLGQQISKYTCQSLSWQKQIVPVHGKTCQYCCRLMTMMCPLSKKEK